MPDHERSICSSRVININKMIVVARIASSQPLLDIGGALASIESGSLVVSEDSEDEVIQPAISSLATADNRPQSTLDIVFLSEQQQEMN